MTTLADLRAEIDEIDDALHDLLIRRVEIGRRVAAAKASNGGDGGPNLRPGREMSILRRLADRNREPLRTATMVAIWRQIFSANLAMQTDLSVVVPTGAGLDATAWAHCGTVARITEVEDTDAALDAVAGGETLVAVLPGLDRLDDWRWWPRLTAYSDTTAQPRIIARLPLFEGTGSAGPADAFVVASAAPEPSGSDRTLFAVAPGGTSNAVLDVDPAGGWSLIEVDGYAERPTGLPGGHAWHRVGAYATPIAHS